MYIYGYILESFFKMKICIYYKTLMRNKTGCKHIVYNNYITTSL